MEVVKQMVRYMYTAKVTKNPIYSSNATYSKNLFKQWDKKLSFLDAFPYTTW